MFRKLFTRINTLENPPPWTLVTALSSMIASFAAVIIGTALTLILLGNAQYGALAGWTIGASITIAFVFIRFRTTEERAALRLGDDDPTDNRMSIGGVSAQQIFLMLLIGVGLSVALDVISGRVTGVFLPEPELYQPFLNALRAQSSGAVYSLQFLSWVFAFFFMVIAQPAAEELIFRGVVLPSLRRSTGAWPGYILAAILYAVFHLLAYSTSVNDFNSLWYGQILPFVAGLIFGAVRLYTGSTRAAILAHAGFGLFAIVKIVTLVG
jgi:membrane protease YdiL (CAAX protease family)